jgi:DNA-binding winged helix-turn-helix (wHTH) protein
MNGGRMRANTSSVTEAARRAGRAVALGLGAVVAILAGAAVLLFAALPDANLFNERVERIFVESESLTAPGDIRLLEILAQSGTAFQEVLVSYRMVIFVLFLVASALLVAATALAVAILALRARLRAIQRSGMQVISLVLSRDEGVVQLNDLSLSLTGAALETLAVLAEARMDDEVLSGAEIEAVISGRPAADCDEAAGATRIKRLRDALGNQLVGELLIRTVPKRGYMLNVDPRALRVI